jgi:asparagine synthase (glutamine-hydrolysing)
MCGLTGFFSPGGIRHRDAAGVIERMRDTLAHRGPDDAGVWLDPDAGIALGHRRLSIVDLSPAGHQPMASAAGRYLLAFNGEIYNHLGIRSELEDAGGVPGGWRGHSDTETLLAAIEAWGLEPALRRCVGMFALALWDRQQRVLSLARDRMGEKPLYYGWQGGTLLFGSELKSLQRHPGFRAEINRDALPLYLRHGYIPAPWSIWKGILKLVPGTIVQLGEGDSGGFPEPVPYWSLEDAIRAGQDDPFVGSDEEAVAALESRLTDAVAGQMMADVPLGAFLSGGIDSSTVVALMQTQSSRPVKTFTIGFGEAGYNEAEHARAVAEHLGTEHTELYVSSQQARELIPELQNLYDEPFGDSSAIPTHLVSRLARSHVTVSLSGDGGDELFGGYGRYFNHKAERIWRTTRAIPGPVRNAVGNILQSRVTTVADELLHAARSALRRPSESTLRGRVDFMMALSTCATSADFYRMMLSQWHWPPAAEGAEPVDAAPQVRFHSSLPEPVERMMFTDSLSYLPDDILVKVDRAAMGVSLETRVPLLDHRVVELAWRLPFSMKVRGGQGKWLLRQLLYRHVPRRIIDRPKMGFGVPVDQWLRGPLRDWAEDLLAESRLVQQGLLDPKPIRARWKQHLGARQNWRDSLWLVLMFQAWIESVQES